MYAEEETDIISSQIKSRIGLNVLLYVINQDVIMQLTCCQDHRILTKISDITRFYEKEIKTIHISVSQW